MPRDWRKVEVPRYTRCGERVIITPSLCGKSVIVETETGKPVACCFQNRLFISSWIHRYFKGDA
jgi:hypothetical protein